MNRLNRRHFLAMALATPAALALPVKPQVKASPRRLVSAISLFSRWGELLHRYKFDEPLQFALTPFCPQARPEEGRIDLDVHWIRPPAFCEEIEGFYASSLASPAGALVSRGTFPRPLHVQNSDILVLTLGFHLGAS